MQNNILNIRGSFRLPIVACIPHSSIRIPGDLRKTILLNKLELGNELLKMTDWYVDELFALIHEKGGVSVRFDCSRLIVDPERFEDDSQEVMASKGMGVIYTKTSDGRKLREDPNPSQRAALLQRFYYPYHQAVTEAVQKTLGKFGQCLILDCHSYPSRPLPYELDQAADRPEICLGIDPFHTPDSLAEKVKEKFSGKRLRVAYNTPFSGTFVPMRFYETDKRVSSLMIELRRDTYMDEANANKLVSFKKLAEHIGQSVVSLV